MAWAGRIESLRLRATRDGHASRTRRAPDASDAVGGWLYKRGGSATRAWQQRFVPPLSDAAPGARRGRPGDTGTLLCYYTDETQSNLRGAVELAGLCAARLSKKTASPPGTEVFKLVTKSGSADSGGGGGIGHGNGNAA